MKIAVIGGGAAGFFAAITCATHNPLCRVSIFERGKSVLEKVRISGGGRCNVTHACFDARELVKNYPRGARELLGPFSKFGPADTVQWFESQGIRLKTESDGRMFPVTDDSQTIVDCLTRAAQKAGVELRTGVRIDRLEPTADGKWVVEGQVFDKIMVATGSSTAMWSVLEALGHQIVPAVPSLFTFNTKDTRLRGLSGVSVASASLTIPGTKLASAGPLLITHWGMSGPAVLKLSAWGAGELFQLNYHFPLQVCFWPDAAEGIKEQKHQHGKKVVYSNPQHGIPTRLWQSLVDAAGINPQQRWADLDKAAVQGLTAQLAAATFQIAGKSTFKEEFVTAGGVSLKEINFKTFESRVCPNLYLGGEVLDIDAITGGFNFQAAWTGGYLAGVAMGS
ncbi:MAG: NAD(P)/FAD-dependent oxidoreductase [Saprospiraceae bacterium]|nr:NAD(P)/FAD-dependent oxidoreductase [Saprospiraceae bacterium]